MAPPNFSLFLVMACFWLVYLLVYIQLVKPLGRVLDEREARVRVAREGFEQARHALAEAVARCERDLAVAATEGGRERASLRASGEATRREKLEAAHAEVQERLSRLSGELDEASRAARATLRDQSGQLARELASRLIGRSVA